MKNRNYCEPSGDAFMCNNPRILKDEAIRMLNRTIIFSYCTSKAFFVAPTEKHPLTIRYLIYACFKTKTLLTH